LDLSTGCLKGGLRSPLNRWRRLGYLPGLALERWPCEPLRIGFPALERRGMAGEAPRAGKARGEPEAQAAACARLKSRAADCGSGQRSP
jgi:hypothetical protein